MSTAKQSGRAHFGASPLWMFVCGKAHDLRFSMAALLDAPSFAICGMWCVALDCFAVEQHSDAVALAISLTMLILASYDERIMTRIGSFPLRLLHLIESAASVPTEMRKKIAGELLDAEVYRIAGS